MNSVIIASPYPLDLIHRLSSCLGASVNRDGTVVVEGDGARVYISHTPEVPCEYEPDELARIRSAIPIPYFYTIEFSSIALCKQVLLVMADDEELVVDNDHGVVLPGNRFAERLRGEADWDWRRE